MHAHKYLLAAAIAVIGLTGAAPASACEAHRQASNGTEHAAHDVKSAPSYLPKALGERAPQTLRVDLETMQAAGKLEDGAGYNQGTPAKK